MRRATFFVCFLYLIVTSAYAEVTFISPEKFVSQSFSGNPPKAKMFWVTRKYKPTIKRILGHKYPALRIRYWGKNNRTVWILEETGKEKPITTGIAINHNQIERISILIYRESRGSEVKYDFFTNQFIHGKLRKDNHLNKNIDGISGATLSVSAITRLARLALYLHSQTRFAGNTK
ncbi:MAG TPA: FMN-binding protein [Gammaproteobacteria bacterium]|nr:FMN-binding protein [Gammaproteobacteria bacterium]